MEQGRDEITWKKGEKERKGGGGRRQVKENWEKSRKTGEEGGEKLLELEREEKRGNGAGRGEKKVDLKERENDKINKIRWKEWK